MGAQLYCFGESGHSYKVALTMELAGYPWQPVFVDYFNGGARSESYRALNPMGEAPVFCENGLVLTQSGVILQHLAKQTGQFAGQDPHEIQRWLFWDNHKFSGMIGTVRFLKNFLPPEKRPEQVIAFLSARLRDSFKVLEQHLTAREWVEGSAPSIADFSCCGYMYYPEPFGFIPADWPAIDAWLKRIRALPGWKHPYDLMPGNPSDRAVKETA